MIRNRILQDTDKKAKGRMRYAPTVAATGIRHFNPNYICHFNPSRHSRHVVYGTGYKGVITGRDII